MTANGKAVVEEPQVEPGDANSSEAANDTCATVVPAAGGAAELAAQPPGELKSTLTWPRLSEGLMVGIGTVTAYFVALTHQSGYNVALGIPEGLIDVSPEALFLSLFPMSLAFALTALVVFVRTAWSSDAPSVSKFWKDVIEVLGAGFCGG